MPDGQMHAATIEITDGHVAAFRKAIEKVTLNANLWLSQDTIRAGLAAVQLAVLNPEPELCRALEPLKSTKQPCSCPAGHEGPHRALMIGGGHVIWSGPFPEVVEVPAGEARGVDPNTIRDGDTVTITARFCAESGPSGLWLSEIDASLPSGVLCDLQIASVSRPSIPLPTEPGAVIRCRIKGLDGIRVAERESDSTWLAIGIDDAYWASDGIEVVEVLYLPSVAGASEGGKR